MPTINKPKKKKLIPYKRFNDKYSQYYNTQKWQLLRNYYLHLHPLCECCEKIGRIRAATEVHHKQFLSTNPNDAWNLLLDENNLMSVCTEHHHAIHTYAHRYGLNYCDYAPIPEDSLYRDRK